MRRMRDPGSSTSGAPWDRQGLALPLLCAAAFLATMDLSVVSIALPSIQDELGFSIAGVQWVLSAYTVALGGLLLLAGRAGDLFGRRRLFAAGLVAFAVFSVAGALAVAPWMLIVARVGQGAAAAAVVPNSLSLLTTIFDAPGTRERALGAYSAMVGAGFAAGTVSGGVATQLLGWRAVLLLNVPVALTVAPLARVCLPRGRAHTATRRLDLMGALTLTGGLSAVIAGLLNVERFGAAAAPTLVPCLAGLALLSSFVWWERRFPHPLVPMEVFTVRTLTIANAAGALKSSVGMAQLYVLTLYFQRVLDASPLQTGLAFLPMALASVAAAAAIGRLVNPLGGPRRTAILGCAVLAAGLTTVALQLGQEAGVTGILLGMVVAEVGFMSAEVPLNAIATASLPERRRGLAAGVLNSSTELGNAFGLAVTATTIGLAVGTDRSLADALRLGLGASVGLTTLALAVLAVGLRPSQTL